MALYINKCFITVETVFGEQEQINIGNHNKENILPKTFQEDHNIKRVELSDGIESICSDAFINCTELEEMTLPASLKEIGAYAFRGCDKLSNIVVNEKITEVEYFTETYSITEEKPFNDLLKNLKEGYKVKFFIKRTPLDDNWR